MRIIEINPSIKEKVDECGGYCPCAIAHVPKTKCMCKEFRELDEPGICHCRRYEKVVD